MLRQRRFSDLLRLSLLNQHAGGFLTADEDALFLLLRNRIATGGTAIIGTPVCQNASCGRICNKDD
tara:strand:- start:134 stop:331 length:198 start_codon:yes stop_codon:yes gene_type:complete